MSRETTAIEEQQTEWVRWLFLCFSFCLNRNENTFLFHGVLVKMDIVSYHMKNMLGYISSSQRYHLSAFGSTHLQELEEPTFKRQIWRKQDPEAGIRCLNTWGLNNAFQIALRVGVPKLSLSIITGDNCFKQAQKCPQVPKSRQQPYAFDSPRTTRRLTLSHHTSFTLLFWLHSSTSKTRLPLLHFFNSFFLPMYLCWSISPDKHGWLAALQGQLTANMIALHITSYGQVTCWVGTPVRSST